MNELMNDGDNYRTAPATPGLLNITLEKYNYTIYIDQLFVLRTI